MKSFKKIFFIIFIFSLVFCKNPVFASTNVVKVLREGPHYTLMLNGKPFYIQGAGVGEGFGPGGENYLQMAKVLGSNAVRTWGAEQGNQKYLDEAAAQGLYVAAGIWMNYPVEKNNISYVDGKEYMEKKEKETLDYVEKFKNHPAILMWNIGNEVIAFTKSEEEKIAFVKFLEQLIQKVHKADPNHPIVYASSGNTDLPYIRKYVPSVDVIGINDYSDIQFIQNRWEDLGFNAPYLMTEYGALGSWDMPQDKNGLRVEQSDYSKAAQYRNYWNRIREKKGNNIGGFIFQIGNVTQDSLTFYNINEHSDKRETYLLIQSLYTGQKMTLHAPRIKSFKGVPSEIAKGAAFNVEVTAEAAAGISLEYIYKASTTIEGVIDYHVNDEVALQAKGTGNKVTLTAPEKEGIYRIYAFVRDDRGNISSVNSSIRVF